MMLPSTSARSPLFALALTASAALIFIFGIVAWQRPSPVSFPPSVREGMYVLASVHAVCTPECRVAADRV
jgi:hypothetical protein